MDDEMMDNDFLKKLSDLGVSLGMPINGQPSASKPLKNHFDETLNSEEVSNIYGSTCLITKSIEQPHTHGHIPLVSDKPLGWLAKLQNLPDLEHVPLNQIIYLDIETTSLSKASGNLPFLIGLCQASDSHVITRQIIMRSPAEEKSALVELIRLIDGANAVVTYNGASFDLDIIRSRLQLHRLPDPFIQSKHLDLLHVTRKLWRNTLPSRSLGYLEMSLLGVARNEFEIPGSQIPQIYYDYIRTGNSELLPGVLYHNEVDIISLAALMVYILGPDYQQPTYSAIHVVDEKSKKEIDCILTGQPIPINKTKKLTISKPALLQKDIQASLTRVGNLIKENNYTQALELLSILQQQVLESKMAPFSRRRLDTKIQKKLDEINNRINKTT
jgi:uncharacterized protein YprB with RNaseH-like and TPR domain